MWYLLIPLGEMMCGDNSRDGVGVGDEAAGMGSQYRQKHPEMLGGKCNES